MAFQRVTYQKRKTTTTIQNFYMTIENSVCVIITWLKIFWSNNHILLKLHWPPSQTIDLSQTNQPIKSLESGWLTHKNLDTANWNEVLFFYVVRESTQCTGRWCDSWLPDILGPERFQKTYPPLIKIEKLWRDLDKSESWKCTQYMNFEVIDSA